LPGENREGQTTYEPDPNTGRQLPQDESMNVIGFNEPLTGNSLEDFGAQGGTLSKVLNVVPTMNATGGMHDYWFNDGNPNKLEFTTFNSVGMMLPAATVSISASIGNYTHDWKNDPTALYLMTKSF
jgi:hypothetical protein